MKKNWMWYVVSLLLLVCDQVTKGWAMHTLPIYRPKTVCWGLNWALMFNSGSAFGFLNNSNVGWHAHVFTGFGLLMSVGLIIWMAWCKAKARLELFALACILSGALGNVIDRIRFGYVIDFIQVYYKEYYFPVFNFADSVICVGAILLFIAGRETKVKRKKSH